MYTISDSVMQTIFGCSVALYNYIFLQCYNTIMISVSIVKLKRYCSPFFPSTDCYWSMSHCGANIDIVINPDSAFFFAPYHWWCRYWYWENVTVCPRFFAYFVYIHVTQLQLNGNLGVLSIHWHVLTFNEMHCNIYL